MAGYKVKLGGSPIRESTKNGKNGTEGSRMVQVRRFQTSGRDQDLGGPWVCRARIPF